MAKGLLKVLSKWLLGAAFEENPKKADVVVLSGTNHYEERNKQVIEEYRKQNKTVLYLISDFHHADKKTYQFDVKGCKQVHVIPYYKNISAARLLSHAEFSLKAYMFLKQHQPEEVYAEIPNNSLALSTAWYKRRYGCRLVFDIFDMWPEALPVKRKNVIRDACLSVWGAFRNRNLKYADKIYTECSYYQEILNKEGYTMPMETKYLCQEDADFEIETAWRQDRIDICYVGSINNIIDMELMIEFLHRLNQKRKVFFHLVGQGESKAKIKAKLENKQIEVKDYGAVYEKEELQKIFNKCSFGMNFLVPNVAIGITMKSVTYFRGGMPILNTVDGDTKAFVTTRNIGLNVERENLDNSIQKVLGMNQTQIQDMKKNARAVFEDFFKKADR